MAFWNDVFVGVFSTISSQPWPLRAFYGAVLGAAVGAAAFAIIPPLLTAGSAQTASPTSSQPLAPSISQSGSGNVIGNNNSVTVIHSAEPRRVISDAVAANISAQLRKSSPHKFTLLDYANGQDKDTHELFERIASILKAGGWIPDGYEHKTFLQIGGVPFTGLSLMFRTEKVQPVGAGILMKVFADNGIALPNSFIPFPAMVDHDETVGLAIGRAQ